MPDYPCQSGKNNHDGPPHSAGPGRDAWLNAPMIEPLQLAGNEGVVGMIDNVFARSGFNGRQLAEGAQLFTRMIDDNATTALTVAGAMTPIGMSGPINALIEQGMIDFIICTGANLYHDLHRPFNCPMVQGTPEADDNVLADDGVARIYDVFIAEDDTMMDTDKAIFEALQSFDKSKPFSTAQLHHALGTSVQAMAPHPEKSILATAAKYDVPIYTSSPGDSSVALSLIVPHLFDAPVMLNPMMDVMETTAIVRAADSNGVLEIGGGSPKNFYLQTQPALSQFLFDKSCGGHDYFLQLTVDAPHWGGLSGATPSEAKSWGKVKDAIKNNVVVYSCASITFPLIAQYALCKAKPRRHRRLFPRIEEFTAALRASAADNERLRREFAWFFEHEAMQE